MPPLHMNHYMCTLTPVLFHVCSYTCTITCVLLHVSHYTCTLPCIPIHVHSYTCTRTHVLLHVHVAAVYKCVTCALLHVCYICTLTCTLLHVHLYVHAYTCAITCVLLHCVCYMCTLTCAPLHVHCCMEATLKLNVITQDWITDSTLCLKLILSSKRCVTKAETQLQMLQSFTLVNRVWDHWPTGKDMMGPCPSPLQPEPRNWISNEMLTLH